MTKGAFRSARTVVALAAVVLLLGGCADELARAVVELYIVDDPVLSPSPGNYGSDVELVMTSGTPGAEIWYTTDGSVPSPSGGTATRYTGPIAIDPGSSPMRFFARAYKDGMTPSDEVIGPYNVEYSGPSAPLSLEASALTDAVYDADSGTWSGAVSVRVTGDPANDSGNLWNDDGLTPRIHYTTDSTIPTASSPSVANGSGIELTQVNADGDDVTVNAVTIVGGAYPNSSAVTLRVRIRFTDRVADPVFSDASDNPLDEVCYGATTVKVDSGTSGADVVVEMQTNGGSWTTAAGGPAPQTFTIFSSPSNGDVVNLRAYATGTADQGDSETVTASFVYIDGVITKPAISPATGTYSPPIGLFLSSDFPGATIYYTTDGSYPEAIPANRYMNAESLYAGTTYYVNAVAEYYGVVSAVSSAVIEVTP